MEPSTYEKILYEVAQTGGSALALFSMLLVALSLRSFSQRLTPWQTYIPFSATTFGATWIGVLFLARDRIHPESALVVVNFVLGTLPASAMWLTLLCARAAFLAVANRRRTPRRSRALKVV